MFDVWCLVDDTTLSYLLQFVPLQTVLDQTLLYLLGPAIKAMTKHRQSVSRDNQYLGGLYRPGFAYVKWEGLWEGRKVGGKEGGRW